MNRVSASIGFLFVLVILTNIPTWFEEEQISVDASDETTGLPNYQASNMRSTIFNDQGEVNHRVFAEHMEHYEDFDLTLFEDPQYTVYTADKSSPWDVSARKGVLYGENRIHLNTDVEIESLTAADFVQRINTHFVEIDLVAKTLKSDQPVTVTGKNFVIDSKGFNADLTTKEFELVNQVQAIYEPHSQQ